MSKFLIFTPAMTRGFQTNKNGVPEFFGKISLADYQTIFITDNPKSLDYTLHSELTSLGGFPVVLKSSIISEAAKDESEKISPLLLENLIRFKSAKIEEGVVVSPNLEDFENFDPRRFNFVLVDRNRPTGSSGKLVTVSELGEILPALEQASAEKVKV
jgi:hypothetical protein